MFRGLRSTLFTILLLVPLSGAGEEAAAPEITAASPDGKIQFHLSIDEPTYSVSYADLTVIERSRFGFAFQDEAPMADDMRISDHSITELRDNWETPWGEDKHVVSHCTELVVDYTEEGGARRMILTVRVFDDGLGFRFSWPEQDGLDEFVITDEQTEFVLGGDPVVWSIPAYAGNRYEYPYSRTRLSALVADRKLRAVHTPVTFELGNGLYVSLHEAALTDYASMTLIPDIAENGTAGKAGHRFTCDLVPWSDGSKVKAATPFQTPWRTIQIAPEPAGLIDSDLILNLNEPSRIEDTSWIRPAKYAGIWWSLHIKLETWRTGHVHGATTENTKRYIDFASENGIAGLLVEGWNTGWDKGWLNEGVFDYTTATYDYDLEEVARYAKENGVHLIGHLETGGDVHGFEQRMDAAFGQCRRLGIPAVKMGYVSHGQGIRRYDDRGNLIAKEWQHGQYMVRHFRKMVERAADYEIMVNVHEPIKDTGIRRTWPNMMTREGARGQEYNAWSEGNAPDHTTILPFTRMLGGPMDYTPGIVNVMIDPYRPDHRVHSTVAKQLALYVVLYSPMQMVTDLPEHYEGHPAFGFIQAVPVDWEESLVLNAEIGDYVTMARRERGGDSWYVGSITDEDRRSLRVPMHFLEPGVEYVADIFADADDAHWEGNPEAMRISRKIVNSDSVLTIDLAAGGGQAIRIRPMR